MSKSKLIRIHLELKDEYLSDYQKRMLKRYGESSTGVAIIRDILIPQDMMLHNLHYAIQSLFGWQNSHLRSFYLPKEVYDKVTEGTVKGWSELVGVLFQPPSEARTDLYWDDEYSYGSFKAWLRKRYTGPYIYKGESEDPLVAREDVKRFLDQFDKFEVRESFREYFERSQKDGVKEVKVKKVAPLIDLTLDEMGTTFLEDFDHKNLLESLEVDKVLAFQDEELSENDIFPTTKEIIYHYDFGDDWIVKMTKHRDCDELLENNLLSEDELKEAEVLVLANHRPVCIYKDGMSVLDDVGGLGGFANFLGTIYEEDDKEEAASSRSWAKSMGWNAAKVSNKKML